MKVEKTNTKKVFGVVLTVFFLFLFAFLTYILWEPFLEFFGEPEVFRKWVEEKGWGARFVFVCLMALQVVVALIPGEGLEMAAGFAFGSVEGTVLTLFGIAIGSALVFFIVRLFGVKVVELFFSVEKIRSLRFLQNKKKLNTVLFLIMLIPGTPKDLISYFVGLTRIKAEHWVILTTVARIPSVVTSTVGGDAIGNEKYLLALVVFCVTAGISLVGIHIYSRLLEQKENKTEKEPKQ